eukprot:scaffold53860_cov31-Tisochrysis_lutea.AAC.1
MHPTYGAMPLRHRSAVRFTRLSKGDGLTNPTLCKINVDGTQAPPWAPGCSGKALGKDAETHGRAGVAALTDANPPQDLDGDDVLGPHTEPARVVRSPCGQAPHSV